MRYRLLNRDRVGEVTIHFSRYIWAMAVHLFSKDNIYRTMRFRELRAAPKLLRLTRAIDRTMFRPLTRRLTGVMSI